MADDEKQKLLADYRGASVIYFEGYDGNLCTPGGAEVSAESSINGQHLFLDFKFIALPNSATDCSITQSSMLVITSP